MQLTDSPEHRQLRDAFRTFFTAKSPETAVRQVSAGDTGFDEVVWRKLTHELGAAGMAVPESYGGAGFSLVEVGILFEEAGRALLCAPLLSTLMATQVLMVLNDETACKELLPTIAAGDCLVTVGWPPEDGASVGAEHIDGTWHLSGAVGFVLDALTADMVIVVAQVAGQPSLFVVQTSTAGVMRHQLPVLDPTRRIGKVTLEMAAAQLLGEVGDALGVMPVVLDQIGAILAAEQVGGAGRALEMAVEYAKTRHQFGRPIGSFQAVKHRCADMYVRVESARAAARYAVQAAAERPDELAVASAIARAYCSAAYQFAAAENIQVHGGIGFTWEHPAHLYFRRANATAFLFGTEAEHHEALLSALKL